MVGAVIFVIELDAAAAPPASDSVRQLLALIDGLPTEGGELDWRLVSLTLNSPLRAELRAFTPTGAEVPETHLAAAADGAFAVLDATNDNDPAKAARALGPDDRRRLRLLIQPLKDRAGSVQVIIPGRPERIVRAERAQAALAALSEPRKRRPPELGSVEGQILEATTYYGNPALRVRQFLSDQSVTCVFDKTMAERIGGAHTVAEVWSGRRVVVRGKINFDASGDPTIVHATDLRSLTGEADVNVIFDEMHSRTDEPFVDPWDDDG